MLVSLLYGEPESEPNLETDGRQPLNLEKRKNKESWKR